jgi:galactose mutarotase-like enzyme
MIAVLENKYLQLKVDSFGAELCSLVTLRDGAEWIWQPKTGAWQGRSPVLFPIIGGQKNGFYLYEGKRYPIDKHGFAMRSNFTLVQKNSGSLCMVLIDSAKTREMYPFAFQLEVCFKLYGNSVVVVYSLVNRWEKAIPYCIGGHTGYQIPFGIRGDDETYCIEFEKTETVSRHLLQNGLLQGTQPLLEKERVLPITDSLFQQGAIVLKDHKSRAVTLRPQNAGPSVRVEFPDFEYLGLWKEPGERFICIEPWIGCTSSFDDSQEILQKDGLKLLPGRHSVSHQHRITIRTEE